jgi:hypothetical protein
MLAVMTSRPIRTVAIHIETDNVLTFTDYLIRLINAHE